MQSEVLGNPIGLSTELRAGWRAFRTSQSVMSGVPLLLRHVTHGLAQSTYFTSRTVARTLQRCGTDPFFHSLDILHVLRSVIYF